MFRTTVSPLPGCLELQPRILADERGRFVKTMHRDQFTALDLRSDFAEEYYSFSVPGVVRGLHFQVPPMEHVKLVYCVLGQVWDVVLDLRRGSPTYLQHAVFELSAERTNMLYIPVGCAHGFCTPAGAAMLIYKVSSLYSPEHDQGLLWNSAGIAWPVESPLLSDRDSKFPALDEFASPFVFSACTEP